LVPLTAEKALLEAAVSGLPLPADAPTQALADETAVRALIARLTTDNRSAGPRYSEPGEIDPSEYTQEP